jgi:hypothetical protein
MTTFNRRRIIVALFTFMLLGLPLLAAAQSSTFVVPFERVGTPGTQVVTQIDPLTGEATQIIVDTGAFVNPCTLEFVDVTGVSTIATLQTIDRFGDLKVTVSVNTKGTGQGWVLLNGVPTPTSSTYGFTEGQQITFRLPSIGEEFSSDFADKLTMKGAKRIDNWVLRAHFRIKVNAAGEVQVFMIKMNADICKG